MVGKLSSVTLLLMMLMNSPAHAIFGGKDVGSKDPFARYGVAIHREHEDGNWTTCSGVLIRRDIVVTAAHCAQGKKENLHVIFFWSIDDAPRKQMRRVSNIAIYDGYTQSSTPPPRDPSDIALLKLDETAPSSALRMQLPDPNLDILQKQPIWIAGYGARSHLKSGEEGADRVLRKAEIPIFTADGSIITFDQSLKTGACNGDSGGPAFIEKDGDYIVIGTTIDGQSYDGGCTSWSHYIDLRGKLDWIDKISHDWGIPNDPSAPEIAKPTDADDHAGHGGQCIVSDPTGTPLNIRDSPLGNRTGQTLSNGDAVNVLSSAQDGKGKWWANIGEGYVYASYLRCDPSASRQAAAVEPPAAKRANNPPPVVENDEGPARIHGSANSECNSWAQLIYTSRCR